MYSSTIIIIAIVVLSVLYYCYVTVVKRKNNVQAAFSCIDVQLKKRYDVLSNILIIAKKFMEHEKNLLEELTNLRTRAISLPDTYGAIDEKLNLNNQFKEKMYNFMISAENYPELKSDNTMVKAMEAYNDTEEHIAAARRFYNSAVLELNNAVEIFPLSVFANILRITKKEYFQASETEQKEIKASDYL